MSNTSSVSSVNADLLAALKRADTLLRLVYAAVPFKQEIQDHLPYGLSASIKEAVAGDSLGINAAVRRAEETPVVPDDILSIVRTVETDHFRTVHDTGAAPQAMTIWNSLRYGLGLPYISNDDLASWDEEKRRYIMPADSKLLTNPGNGGPV